MPLAWDASTSSDVVGYNVYYGNASGNYPNKVSPGKVTSTTISNLLEGTTYFFVATAYNALGLESDPSNELSYSIPAISIPTNVINKIPTLNAIGNLTLNEDAGIQSVNLSGITSGAVSENQNLTVTATSSDPGLIPNPTVTYTSPNTTGTLTFTPAASASGTATISVTVNDGQSQSNLITLTFSVTVTAINDEPTLATLGNLTLNENAGQQTVNLAGITSGAVNEAQTLTVTATSSNPGLIPNPTVNYTSPQTNGTLTFTPIANASGTAIIAVIVNENHLQNNTVARTFTVTVNASNRPPTLSALSNLTLNESASLQTINLSGITSGATNETQTLTVTATSSNPGLIPNPTVNYTSPKTNGTLTFTPAASASGTATVTVTINDGQTQNNTIARTFTVTVNASNRPPTLNALSNLTLSESAGQQTVNLSGITSGATNETQTLTVTATSSNPSLIPNPTVTYTSPKTNGTLTFTPVASASGTATVTVTVNDGQTQNNTIACTFTVTVNASNRPPTLNALSNLTLSESASLQTINLSGITSGATNETQTLTVTATSSNPSLIPNPTVTYTSPKTNGTLTFTPVASASGNATVTVTVNDGQAQNNTFARSFTVTVNASNRPPSITIITNQTTAASKSVGPISFKISDRETPATNLTLSASSSAPTIIAAGNITFGGSGSNRTVTLAPLPGQSGDANITITVSDGSATASTQFQLTVTPPTAILTVVVKGSGNISPNLNQQPLLVGKTYTMTATPAPEETFAGWKGPITASTPQLNFVMTTNLTLEANFVPCSFIPAKGDYNGLFYEDDEVRQNNSGSFALSVTTNGAYSGQIQILANRYSFSGQLRPQGPVTNVISRNNAKALTIKMWTGSGNQSDQVFGRVTDGVWVAPLSGDRAVFDSKTNPAPYAASYTTVIPTEEGGQSVPLGYGFGTVKVDANGKVTFAGTLADGTAVSQSATISKNGLWPLYLPLYSGRGSLISWMAFTNQSKSDLNGRLSWIKPSDSTAKYYAKGLTNESIAIGSVFTPPSAQNNSLTGLTNVYLIGMNGSASNLSSSNKVTLTLSTATGTFTGSATNLSTRTSQSFSGAVLLKLNAGYGFLLGTNAGSQILLSQ